MILDKNSKMGTHFFHEFKRQASFFFREKIKTARLALTDVTPAELLTEEATNGDSWTPDTRAMAVISRAAFEVDDYWRIVDILHKKLMKFDRKTWRVSYKTLLLLEHLLTHGPLRVYDEFQNNKEVIKEIGSFQFVDEKGFNWGCSVRNLSARILKLLESELFLRGERARARKLTRGIQGFGSFSFSSPSPNESFKDLEFRACTRCNSNYNNVHHNQDYESLASDDTQNINGDINTSLETAMEDHPFCNNDLRTTASLLSSLE